MAESTKNMTVGAGSASASVTATVTDQMPGVPCPTTPGYTYTGMRYVPVFADPAEWSSANSYEPLEIVIHEGNSYTSKTFVPVGIDISNSAYWALTGNYNAQVEQYRQEVQAFDGRITENANGVAANAEAIEKLQPLQHSREFKGANIIYMSDSWGTKNYGVTKPYMELMGEMLGANVYNLSVGSTGFIAGGQNNFINRLTAWVAANPALVENIDYVMVCGSSNDYASTRAEISKAIDSYIAYALSAFPNAQIVLVPQFAARNPAYASVNAADDNIWRKVNVSAIVSYWNNVFPRTRMINGTFWALRFAPPDVMNSDNVHPTQKGHNYLAKWMVASLTEGQQGSPIINVQSMGTDYTAHSLDSNGDIVETFTNVGSVHFQLMFNAEGVFQGNITFSVLPTKAANTIALRSPMFVKLNAESQAVYSWGSAIVGSTYEVNIVNMQMNDTGKTMLPDSGAFGQLVFGGLETKIKPNERIQIMLNLSLVEGYQTAGQN